MVCLHQQICNYDRVHKLETGHVKPKGGGDLFVRMLLQITLLLSFDSSNQSPEPVRNCIIFASVQQIGKLYQGDQIRCEGLSPVVQVTASDLARVEP